MFTQDNGLKDDISPYPVATKTYQPHLWLQDATARLWLTSNKGWGAEPIRQTQDLYQHLIGQDKQTNKIYADKSAIVICYPQLEQVFQQYLSQSVFLCWEENKKVSKQISLYLFNNFFLYVYIKGSFQEK